MSEKDELRAMIRQALEPVDEIRPQAALNQILEASEGTDQELGANVRRLLPLVVFGLMGLQKGFDDTAPNRRPGRPRVLPEAGKDGFRAYRAWHAVKVFKEPGATNRRAIHLVREMDRMLRTPPEDCEFSPMLEQASAEQSLSRGKKLLGINERWESGFCQDIFECV